MHDSKVGIYRAAIFLIVFSFLETASAQKLDVVKVTEADSEIGENLRQKNSVSGDTLKLLKNNPSVQFQTGGGISSVPVIHGMASDRVRIQMDEIQATPSCPNHMNPALSYVTPNQVDTIESYAGVVPVSLGGDSLGGSIVVKTRKASFTLEEGQKQFRARFSSLYGSNEDYFSASLNANASDSKNAVEYTGTEEKARDYTSGNDQVIKGTLYQQRNHALSVARKLGEGVATLRYRLTQVPKQGFVNQSMDLLKNTSNLYHLNYIGRLLGLESQLTFSHQNVNHFMDKLPSVRSGRMPMETRSDENNLNAKVFLPKINQTQVQLGTEAVLYRLKDWWPSAGMGSMQPDAFVSINNGRRNRFAFFAESETEWSPDNQTHFGLRTDIIHMNTGTVQGYNNYTNAMSNLPGDAAFFNSLNRKRIDQNYDFSMIQKLKWNELHHLDFGVGRKSRSPNLYERYAWAGSVNRGTNAPVQMDMRMINWFGDGNGYVGNLHLHPEVAHTLSLTYRYESNSGTAFRVTPYYSDIRNFIDADLLSTDNLGRRYLQFANHDAKVFGADFSIQQELGSFQGFGRFDGALLGSVTRGYRKDGVSDLYHQMPLNGKMQLNHQKQNWTNGLELMLVTAKEKVSVLRREPKTRGYALLDFSTGYSFVNRFHFNFRVSNLLDRFYNLPLGGRDVVSSRENVAGRGRSFHLSFSMDLI